MSTNDPLLNDYYQQTFHAASPKPAAAPAPARPGRPPGGARR